MIYLRIGVIYVLLAVIAGAASAHALRLQLEMLHTETVFGLARDYLAYHGLALVAAGFAETRVKDLRAENALYLLALGAAIFSGALFVFALSLWQPIAHLAPLGGGLMIIGWCWLLLRALRHKK